MAFTRPATGQTIQATDVTQIVDAWEGVAGSANRVQITQVNDASNYAVDVQNLDTTNSYGLRVRDSSSNVIATFALAAVTFAKKVVMTGLGTFTSAANMLDIAATWNAAAGSFNAIKVVITNTASAATSWIITLQTASATVFGVTIGGIAFLNDDANAKMTQGLTINQGASDDEAIACKSSDIAHGITDDAETDTYFTVSKNAATDGGALIAGYAEATSVGMVIASKAGAVSTAKTTGAGSGIYLSAQLKSGTGSTICSADANLAAIANDATVRFIFDAEGSGHADVEWTTYSVHDDLALVADMEAELLAREDSAKTERRHALEQIGIIGKDSWHSENGKPRAMVNFTKLAQLHHGALLQSGQRIAVLEQQNAILMAELATIKRALLPVP